MGNKFCTACGAALSEKTKFCENCGAPAGYESPPQDGAAPVPGDTPAAAPPVQPVAPKKIPVVMIAGIVAVLVIAAVVALFVLPGVSPVQIPGSSGQPSPTITPAPTILPSQTQPVAKPTPVPEQFPGALKIKDNFPFGSGELASEGTVYRVWLNSTYDWHNDMDNKYYTQKPKAGNKYLFVFVNVFNNGSTRVWPPTSNNVRVYYDGTWYAPDPVHYLPNKAADRKATPIEVKEIQYYSKLYGSEYVEDFGYSHGTQTAYLYPGKSNAIDGYIIYEVPSSLTLDKAYARIAFNGNDTAVWKLG